MFYGDSMIMPAISVLSAVEGLRQMNPKFDPLVVPFALTILLAFRSADRLTLAYGIAVGVTMLITRAQMVTCIRNPACALDSQEKL